ncbi:Mur ligase domain-containing protein, partial [Bacteroidales bacterium OttesenSCG-928-A14]|nr:Mur ligase domain-containing protein [Bacteroidales bacterium OttesenSCG-928-A14]
MIASLYQLYEKYPDISTDTRNILPQSIFFCLKGENFNGNTFARQALANGAAYVVSDDSANLDLPNTIIVPNVLETLQQLALYHRKQLAIPVIGITGTNGKTTTKELVNAVLSQHYKTACTKGNFNNHIGVPLTLLSIRSNDEIAVVEMGANHAGEIAELCDLALPTAGIVTNIGKAHLEGFGSIEHIIETKTALYRSVLQNNGQIFINIDDPILTGYFETLGIFDANHGNPPSTPFSCYSQFNKEVVHGSVICQNPCLKINLFGEKVNTNMTGAYNIYNILSAVAVGIHFGITKTQIIHALQSYIPDNNRSQVVAKNGMTLIADYYNANPTSMEAALRNLASL